jgi:hypothetical protein
MGKHCRSRSAGISLLSDQDLLCSLFDLLEKSEICISGIVTLRIHTARKKREREHVFIRISISMRTLGVTAMERSVAK